MLYYMLYCTNNMAEGNSMGKSQNQARENVSRYRDKMRTQGFRPIQIWVPDTRSPTFAEECRRQSLLISNDAAEESVLGELDAAARDIEDWK